MECKYEERNFELFNEKGRSSSILECKLILLVLVMENKTSRSSSILECKYISKEDYKDILSVEVAPYWNVNAFSSRLCRKVTFSRSSSILECKSIRHDYVKSGSV